MSAIESGKNESIAVLFQMIGVRPESSFTIFPSNPNNQSYRASQVAKLGGLRVKSRFSVFWLVCCDTLIVGLQSFAVQLSSSI